MANPNFQVHHESVRINMNEKGELVVAADKKAIDQPARRQIPITFKSNEKQWIRRDKSTQLPTFL